MLSSLFNDFIRYAEQVHLPIEGLAIADGSQVLFNHRFTPDLARNIYSHTKSYMVTAVGMAVSDGKLSLDDRLAEYFPESLPEDPDPRLLKIRLRDLLTMSSGFGQSYLMGKDRRAGVGMPDYVKYMLSRPMLMQPGKKFCYSTADSILAGRMVEKAVGVRLGEYLFERLHRPLGQGYPQWENCPQGHPIGGGGMYLKLTEMMKLGQLYLAEGRWEGQQLVDPAWVKEAASWKIATDGGNVWDCGYGYQFWMSPYPQSYRADGAYGQISTVLPEKGLVVACQCPETGDFDRVRDALHAQFLSQL